MAIASSHCRVTTLDSNGPIETNLASNLHKFGSSSNLGRYLSPRRCTASHERHKSRRFNVKARHFNAGVRAVLAMSTRRRGVPESGPRFAEEHGGHRHLDTHVSPEYPRHEPLQFQSASLMSSCTPNTSSRDHKHIQWTFDGRHRLGNLEARV
jgi:hypothetical protein